MTAVSAKGITRGAQADDASVGRLAAPRATDRSRVRNHGGKETFDIQDINS
jgi:hypothetical protein